MTYAQLDARANQLAAYLQARGVGTEVPVAICLERSFDYVAAALAVWKAGGAYVPLDPAWPAPRREFVIKDSGTPLLVTRSAWAIPGCAVVKLDTDQAEIARAQRPLLPAGTARDHLAYVMYTSGSAGQPKGVEITHGNLLNLMFWHRRTFNVTASDRASHLAGLAFDAAAWELWPYLTAGAQIVLAPEAVRTSPDLLRDWLASQQITLTFVPTTLAEPMLSAAWPPRTRLRYLLTGADTLRHRPSTALPFAVVNNYGPTECTVVATSGVVAPAASTSGPPSIGRPIAHAQVYLLDEKGCPVEPGQTGEIYIGGTGVARGYRGRPDLTAERFVPDPFSAGADGRMYRTGDLGRLLPDGTLAFGGRLDRQVKIRGHRVEPDGIADVLAGHPGIAACAVVARESAGHERHLTAYVVPSAGLTPSSTGLREFLSQRVPEYTIPAAFVRLPALPCDANGKLDRTALPEPAQENILPFAGYRPPESFVEKRISTLLENLLYVDRVGLDDDFFLLGGQSLLGAQLLSRVRDQLGADLTLRELFDAPTVASLAREVERRWVAGLDSLSQEEARQLLERMEQA
jgi:amino acid adenylation domain-containing protein